MTTPNYVKASIAAAKLGVSVRVLRLWDASGRIDAIRPGGERGMRLFDVEGYLAKQVAGVKEKQQTDLLSGPSGVEVDGELAEGADGTTKCDAAKQPIEPAASDQLVQIDPWEKDVEEMFLAVHEKAAKDGCKFPICFESAAKWIGFSRKDHAKTHLLANFVEHEDFESSRSSGNMSENKNGAAISHRGSAEKIFMTADAFKCLCMSASTAQGKRVRRFYLNLERRLREGDLTLAGEIVTNYDRRHGTTTTVLLNTAAGQAATKPPSWVPLWKEARSQQKDRGVILREVLKEMDLGAPAVYAIVENLHNAGVLGFAGTSKQWKKDNGIPDAKPVAECMDHMQLALREQFSEKLGQMLSELNDPSPCDIKRAALQIKEKISQHSAWLGLQEYRPKTDDAGGKVYIGKRVRQLEAAANRSTKRLATLERKQRLLETVPVESLGPAPTGTVACSARPRTIGDFFSQKNMPQ